MNRRLWLIAYDVADPKRWRRIYRLLLGHGEPVQFSLFECRLSDVQLESLLDRLAELIDPGEDRVHCYPLCGQCDGRAKVLGTGGRLGEPPDCWVVSDA